MNNENYIERVLYREATTNPAAMSVLAEPLLPEVFTNPVLKRAYTVYRMFWQHYGRLPNHEDIKMSITKDDLARCMVEAEAMGADVDAALVEGESYDTFMELAQGYIRKRRGALVLNETLNDYQNNRLDADAAVLRFQEVASLKLVQDIGFDLYEGVDDFIAVTADEGGRISTGFADIDEKMGGGIPAAGKFLGVVSAPTNMGKSIFLGNLAVNAARAGKSVLVITLEMSEAVYASRIYSALYGINISELPFKGEELKRRVEEERLGEVLIKEFPPGTVSVDELSGYIDGVVKSGRKIDLICVDYLTLLAAPGTESSNEAGKVVSRKLRALSYKFAAPVFTAAQINRDGFGSTPDMKFMAESIAICSESDLILSLYRQKEDVELGIMRVFFLKSRLGARDVTSRLYFNTPLMRFENLKEDLAEKTVDAASTAKAAEEAKTDGKLADIMGL